MKKQQVIFVCGPDRCGKTEIASALAKALNIPYFKASKEHESYKLSMGLRRLNSQPPPGSNKEVVEFANTVAHNHFMMQLLYADPRTVDIFKQGKFSMVFDRGFPCEEVYSRVFNRNTNFDQIKFLDQEWAKLDAKIVICHRSSYEGFVDDLDPRIDARKLQELDDAYKEYFAQTKCNALMLNVDDENLERELNDILGWLGD